MDLIIGRVMLSAPIDLGGGWITVLRADCIFVFENNKVSIPIGKVSALGETVTV